MPANPNRSYFWHGARGSFPFLLVVIPFSMLFGVVGTEAGLNLIEVMGFSILVIAGASQFTALQLMHEQAPTIIVLLASLTVNLRMAMYSASLTPYMGRAPIWQRAFMAYFMVDQPYAMSMEQFVREPDMTLGERVSYYFGVAFPVCTAWYIFTASGAIVGRGIPPEYALDFAMPITFLAMVAPGLRTLAHVAAAIVSVTLALLLAFIPYSGGLLIAAVCAMITGARVELILRRHGKWT